MIGYAILNHACNQGAISKILLDFEKSLEGKKKDYKIFYIELYNL